MKVLGPIEPQPPKGIAYMLGNESWLEADKRTFRRLHVEEWGNLGPMEIDPSIKPNRAGFRVRTYDFLAPAGADSATVINGKWHWVASSETT